MINALALVYIYQLYLTASLEGVSFSNHKVIDATRNASGGIITSPGSPGGNYTHNVAYTWSIKTGNPKSVVHLKFDYFRIFQYQNPMPRCNDFLQINRTIPCCKPAFKRCGTLKPFELSITGSVITISFVSDSVYNDRGFFLNWIVYIPETPTTSLNPLMMSTKTSSTTETTPPITKTTTLATISSNSKYGSKTFAQTGRTTHKTWFLTTDTTQKISTFVHTLSDNDQNTNISAVYLIVGISVAELTLIVFGIYMYVVRRRQETH